MWMLAKQVGQFPQGLLFGLARRQQQASQQGRFSLVHQDRLRIGFRMDPFEPVEAGGQLRRHG